MSRTAQAVFELQENDDSFDGQGWIDEIEASHKLERANQAPVVSQKVCLPPLSADIFKQVLRLP